MSPLLSSCRRPLPALLAILLAGCASTHGLAPQASAPADVDRLSAGDSLRDATLSPAAWPEHDWWRALGDPSLDALIQHALAAAPSLDAADARLRRALAQAGMAEAGLRPTLGATAQQSRIDLPDALPAPVGGMSVDSTLSSLRFAWAPDLWGGQRARLSAALGAAHATAAEAQAARMTLAGNIAHAWVALAQAYDTQAAARAELRRNAKLNALGEQRVRAGIDNRIPLEQSRSAEAAARAQVKAAGQQIEALRNTLAILAGEGPDFAHTLARPKPLTPAIALPARLPSELISRRADVAAARWRVEAALRNIQSAKADFHPSLNLAAMVGVVSPSLGQLFKRESGFTYAAPAISLPILDGGRLRSQLAGRHAEFDLAIAEHDQTVLTAIHQVINAVQAARALDARIAAAMHSRQAAAQATDLMRQRRQAGIASQLDVLNAERPLAQLDQQLAQLRARRLDAAIDLDLALGGGLPATPLPASHEKTATP
ncbi:efflux transporter outer membrane subunit [Lysobacter pythonis]|uniref:Efflux transporter outer membrane subunit n=1 Tax=Solilutibacter pythonis TaxID=2483112 RepID=A0A3M2I2R3_9GAMM|nr:efflux transporter outer membrane subunit [Lysobacter pythonis]RMH94443.1 efflux transporter outer membrane subunit [Lysobacter pythonis]